MVTIRFADGSSHEALILRLSGAVIRLALKDRADTIEVTLSGETWFCSEVQQEVFFDFSFSSQQYLRMMVAEACAEFHTNSDSKSAAV